METIVIAAYNGYRVHRDAETFATCETLWMALKDMDISGKEISSKVSEKLKKGIEHGRRQGFGSKD